MPLPGTTNLSAFGNFKRICFKRVAAQAGGRFAGVRNADGPAHRPPAHRPLGFRSETNRSESHRCSRIHERGVVPGRCDRWSHIPKPNASMLPLQAILRSFNSRTCEALIASTSRASGLTAPAIPAVPNLLRCRFSKHAGTPHMGHFEKFIRRMNLPGTTNLSAFGHSIRNCFERDPLSIETQSMLQTVPLNRSGPKCDWVSAIGSQVPAHPPVTDILPTPDT